MTRVVIAGAGQAGFQAAHSLRLAGFDGEIMLVGDEGRLPYQRPPLSKAYLKDDFGFYRLPLRPENFYEQNRIELRLSDGLRQIHREAGRVQLASGTTVAFDHLILALGARNRVLALPGAGLPGVHLLRSAAEAEQLRLALGTAERLAVIGGGFIGLEVAASARLKGLAVTVYEATDRLMGRVVSPAISDFFLEAHRAMGTKVVLGAAIIGIAGETAVRGVETDRGFDPADLVLMAAGVVPNDEVAAHAGLETAGGITVDRFMTTSDSRIFAIGDCAVFHSRHAAGWVRLESVQNAVDQAKCVAARIIGGDTAYDSVPWFWSDQGSYKLQIAGITASADHVHVAGSFTEGRLITYCFGGDRLLGIETVNRPGDHMAGRKFLSGDFTLAKAEIASADFDLKSHLGRLSGAIA